MDRESAMTSSSAIPPDDPNRQLTVADPDAAGIRHVSVAGGVYTILVSGAETAGRYCLIDMLVPDGGGPPPHRHDFEEMFTLLQGDRIHLPRPDSGCPRRIDGQYSSQRSPCVQEYVGQDGPHALSLCAGGTGGTVPGYWLSRRQPHRAAAESQRRSAGREGQAACDAGAQISDRNFGAITLQRSRPGFSRDGPGKINRPTGRIKNLAQSRTLAPAPTPKHGHDWIARTSADRSPKPDISRSPARAAQHPRPSRRR